jgi:hypothetical protein
MHPSMQPSVRHPRPGGRAWLLFTWLLVGPIHLDASAAPTATDAAAAPAAKAPEGKRPPLPPGRKVEFLSAVVLWCALVALWLGLLAMVMMWGRRLRRALRRESSASTAPDPFWYLKKGPSAVTHGNEPDRLKETETGEDSDGRPMP